MNRPSGKIAFAGGGTGGHVYPALATIEALQQMGDFQFLYIGSKQGIENKIVPGRGIEFRTIWISGFQRSFSLKNLLFPLKLLVSLWHSWKILSRFEPGVVVGTGGYVSGPVVYVASRKGIPTVIQEQDSYPGVTTRLLARYADLICAAYREVEQHLERPKGRFLVTGNPVRMSLQMVSKEEAAAQWGFDPERPVLLVFGGSQGAQSLNRAVSELAERLIADYGLQILWQTGERNYAEISVLPVARHAAVKILPYIERMALAYSAADLIVSRAGAITLAELSQVQKPVVLVPYPYAAANHQEHNARTVAEAGAAMLVREMERVTEELEKALRHILEHPEQAAEMGRAWQQFYHPEAARTIAAEIVHLLKERESDAVR